MLNHILKVRLLPPSVPKFCQSCADAKRRDCFVAKYWVVAPDGVAVQTVCEEHGQKIVADCRRALEEEWTLHEIYHTDRSDNTTHERGPICGHSTCSQAFIETGENACECPEPGSRR